jgi:hypothetical protein
MTTPDHQSPGISLYKLAYAKVFVNHKSAARFARCRARCAPICPSIVPSRVTARECFSRCGREDKENPLDLPSLATNLEVALVLSSRSLV